MTLDDVKRRVEEIRAAAYDDEKAHGMEDDLLHDVLREIARGGDTDVADAPALAAEALKTLEIDFARWCA